MMRGQIAFAGMLTLLMVILSSTLMLWYLHSYEPGGWSAATPQNISATRSSVNSSIYPYSRFGIRSDG